MNTVHEGGSSPLEYAHSQMSLVEIFFPGFSVISTSAKQLLGGDSSSTHLLFVCGVLLVFIRYTSSYIKEIVQTYFTSTIHISYYDEAYDMVIDWISQQPFVNNANSLIARVRSRQKNAPQTKNKPLTFSPWNGSFPFWYKQHLLILHCSVKDHREDIYISSIGRSPNILKNLIEECRKEYLNVIRTKISVFEHEEGEWKKAWLKQVRPITTVIIDKEVKNDLSKDMEEFLDEPTQRWYAECGLPYRRGYLFFGPPGTGKSSFSFSIAGQFGPDIYALNLSSVSDSKLIKLFAELPPHCVILLEDVDAAGVARRDGFDTNQKDKPNSRVTLSRLLNALDGVSSPEGRVLIMTTNHIERLDEALIRPGRVDKKVHFKLADRHITAQLFRMIFKQTPDAHKYPRSRINGETVGRLADEFATKVPEQVFSPAEVLAFLLEHKKSPIDAVAAAKKWVVKAKEATSQPKKDSFSEQ